MFWAYRAKSESRPCAPATCRDLTCIRRGARKSPLIRPAGFAWRSVPKPACRGPHLYPKVRPEIAFDPSRRFCLAFRPESVGGWGCVQTDTTGRSVPRPAGALTCIRWCARKWPLIRPAGFARRSVPLPNTLQPSREFPGLLQEAQNRAFVTLAWCHESVTIAARRTARRAGPKKKIPAAPPKDHQFYQFHQFHRWGAFSVILAAFLATSKL